MALRLRLSLGSWQKLYVLATPGGGTIWDLAIGAELRLKGVRNALMRLIAGRTRYPDVILTMEPSDWETWTGRKKGRICV